MTGSRALFFALAAVLSAAVATGDEVVLKSGRRLSGDVVSKTETSIALQTPYGTVTLDTADVAKVVYATQLEKDVRAQLQTLPASDTTERLKLASKAASAGLETLATDIYTQIIAIDGEQPAARKALGYVLYEGEWVTLAERSAHPGLVPYQGRWITAEGRDALLQGEAKEMYFASFDLSAAEGAAVMSRISDIDVQIEPRGGYVVRRHVQSFEAKDKPYVFDVSALNWQRLGVFVGVSFVDAGRKRTEGFGELEFTVFETEKDALGAPRVGRVLHNAKVRVKPDMWSRKSDFKYWDSRVSGGYEKIPSDAAKGAWESFDYMNYDGIIYVLANRDINLLTPPGVYFIEAKLTCGDRQKTVGRFVQYAELR